MAGSRSATVALRIATRLVICRSRRARESRPARRSLCDLRKGVCVCVCVCVCGGLPEDAHRFAAGHMCVLRVARGGRAARNGCYATSATEERSACRCASLRDKSIVERAARKGGKAHRCAAGHMSCASRAGVALRASVVMRPPQRWNGLGGGSASRPGRALSPRASGPGDPARPGRLLTGCHRREPGALPHSMSCSFGPH